MDDSHTSVIPDTLDKIGRIIPSGNSKIEIELRYFLDERKKADVVSRMYPADQVILLAKDLITKYKNKPSAVSQTINFMNGRDVKQMVFINGEQQKDKMIHYTKTPVLSPITMLHRSLPAYRLAVGFETPIKEFAVSSAERARIRLRYTITLDEWQIDITLLKTIEDFSNPANLKTAKNTMLFPITTANFIEKAPWDKAEVIELELEYIGKRFTAKSLLFADSLFDGTALNEQFVRDESMEEWGIATTSNQSSSSSSNSISAEYQSVIYQIAQLIRKHDAYKFKHADGLKQLSNQVIELDKNMFLQDVLHSIGNYFITDKIDGTRAMVYVNGTDVFVVSKDLTRFSLENNDLGVCIFDTEEYKDSYYIFDVMMIGGKQVSNLPFTDRMTYFEQAAKLHPKFKTKEFLRLTADFKKEIATWKKRKTPYETDGIILTPATEPYDTMTVYKYKPIEKLSIDFLIKKCPDRLLGIAPYVKKPGYTLYLLFSGVRSDSFIQQRLQFIKFYEELFPHIDGNNLPKYFPIQFEPSDFTFGYLYWDKKDNLDGEVGEFVCGKCINGHLSIDDPFGMWTLHKIRSDRKSDVARGNYFGNNYKIAELTWMSYKEPLVIEELETTNYFQEHDNPLQKATRNFNSFVKAQIFEQFAGTEWTIDLASGKGQDLRRYSTYKFRNVAFMEIDNVALLELIKRKHELRESPPIRILAHQLDLNAKFTDNITKLEDIKLPTEGVDLIMCHFAFHYFLADKKSLINVGKFIQHFLKPGGRFVFTTFDAKAVVQLLNENKGEWTVKTGEHIKYSIKKQYTTTFLDLIGQKVDVLLPFSNSQYYTEYLVNIDYISDELAKLGFTLENDQAFGEYLESYKKKNPMGFAAMNADDKKYSGLYHYYCFYKKKAPEKAKK